MLQDAIQKADEGDYTLVKWTFRNSTKSIWWTSKIWKYANLTPMKYANIKLSCSSWKYYFFKSDHWSF